MWSKSQSKRNECAAHNKWCWWFLLQKMKSPYIKIRSAFVKLFYFNDLQRFQSAEEILDWVKPQLHQHEIALEMPDSQWFQSYHSHRTIISILVSIFRKQLGTIRIPNILYKFPVDNTEGGRKVSHGKKL